MKFKRDFLWLILFGTLVGLNETVLGSAHIHNKSVILSVISLLLLSVARFIFPAKGTSLLITGVAVLFKLNDVGVCGCRPEALIMLGVSFEIFASLMIKGNTRKTYLFSIVNFITALFVFAAFAVMMRYFIKDEYWFNSKFFTQYIFIKGPITAVASAVFCYLGILAVKPLLKRFNNTVVSKTYIVQGTVGVLILACWLFGYFTV